MKQFFLSTLEEVKTESEQLIRLGWRIISVSASASGYVITAEKQQGHSVEYELERQYVEHDSQVPSWSERVYGPRRKVV